MENGPVAPFRRSETTHVAMGRFGNVPLIGGESNLSLTAHRGEVVRFYLTNTAFGVFKNSMVLMLLVYWSTLIVHAIGLHGCERRSIHSLSSLPPSQDG